MPSSRRRVCFTIPASMALPPSSTRASPMSRRCWKASWGLARQRIPSQLRAPKPQLNLTGWTMHGGHHLRKSFEREDRNVLPAQAASAEAELRALERNYCSYGDTVHYLEKPPIFARCEGCYVYDEAGSPFLDLQMWYSAVNFG